ncbi:nucleoside hydrolase [Streptomyces sp. NPDC002004]
MAVPIMLDCDPGHDDAIAILLAASHPAVELRAITTVAGNNVVARTTLNARRVCTVAGIKGVPIGAGAEAPLSRPLVVAADVHGESGLDGADFPAPTVDVDGRHAVDLMRAVLHDSDRPVTLVATGPLTNVALLLHNHPHVRDRIERIVLMGGSTGRGNTTPYAEFNIHTDPEAADIVFSSGLPVAMFGLNITHQALVTPEITERLRALGTPLARTCVGLMTFFADAYRANFGFSAPPLHDPVAVAYVIDPAVATTVRAPVAIETAGTYTSGATAVDCTTGRAARTTPPSAWSWTRTASGTWSWERSPRTADAGPGAPGPARSVR